MKHKKTLLLLLIILIAVSGYFVYSLFLNGGGNSDDREDPATDLLSDITKLEILCAGDIMYHSSQLAGAKWGEEYRFDECFRYVGPYIHAADLSIFNLETVFGGPPYTGYPSFSTPDNLARTLRKLGFDQVSTSNNHMNDRGIYGMDRTLSILRQEGFVTTGSRDVLERQRWAASLVKGVWVGTLAYTYQTPSTVDRVSINGSFVSQETADRINSFSYEYLERDLGRIDAEIQKMKEKGIDIIILYLHWGEEYQLKANMWQRRIADHFLANNNVDIIFGSHPHTLQEMELVNGKVPVYYSLGNFVSNQRRETLGAAYKDTETGAMARVSLDYDRVSKEIVGVKAEAIPIWVEKYYSDGRDNYFIIPLDDNMDENPDLQKSGHLERARVARKDALALLGSFSLENVLKVVSENAGQ